MIVLYFVLFTSPAKMSEQIVLSSEQERIPEECIVPVFYGGGVLRTSWKEQRARKRNPPGKTIRPGSQTGSDIIQKPLLRWIHRHL